MKRYIIMTDFSIKTVIYSFLGNSPGNYPKRYKLHLEHGESLKTRIYKNYSNIKFQENPSRGSRIVPCGQTDMKKLIVAFHVLA